MLPTGTLRAALIALGAAAAALSTMSAASAAAAPSPQPTLVARPGEPWWVSVGLVGMRVDSVVANGDNIVAVADGHAMASDDGGRSFSPAQTAPAPGSHSCDPALLSNPRPARQGDIPASAVTSPDAEVVSGADHWSLCAGRVYHADAPYPGAVPRLDGGSPDLGRGATLLAAPAAAAPGTVVAVATDGAVWRRTTAGTWNRALLLLPQSLIHGAPRVTAVTAFSKPLTGTVYLATDGYSVLISTDGGDDWLRAGPGLPDNVLALTADSTAQAVYAGTTDGLWVHHLQPIPAPPAYAPQDLTARQGGTALVTLAASMVALLLLRKLVA